MPRLPRISHPLRFVLACLTCAFVAASARATTVTVSPSDTTVTLGANFMLRIVTDAFPDLKAYELIYKYGGTITYLGPIAGDVLTGTGQPYTVNDVPDAVAPADTAWTDCAQLVTSTAGPGVLLYLRFHAQSLGDSPIQCLLVDFRDSQNTQTLPACSGGIVRVRGPVPARTTTWGRLKTIYR
jgi:hypothetical protein